MENLRILRKRQGYTQQDIAKFLSLPRSTYRNYEAGIAAPSIETLASLADFYNLSLDELLGRVPEQQLFDDSRVDRPEILELLDQMTPAEQMSVVSYARGILSSRDLRSDADSRFYKTHA